jgi:UDP-N-acetylmuramoylalanine--D-glutamate ligase
VRLEHSEVVVPEIGPLDLGGFQLLGEHNLLNVCGALTGGLLLTGGLGDKGRLERELSSVTAPRCRLEPIGSLDGVGYIDDALASNPEGTLAALKVFAGTEVALIVGGHDRDYGPLARAIQESSPQPIVFLIGEAGAAIAGVLEQISSTATCHREPSLEAAVDHAASYRQVATVLFSPAAPTPREEGNYLDRSRRFRHAVGLDPAPLEHPGKAALQATT